MEDHIFKIDFLFKMHNIIELALLERKDAYRLKRKYIELMKENKDSRVTKLFDSYKYILNKCLQYNEWDFKMSVIHNYPNYSSFSDDYNFSKELILIINESLKCFFELKYTAEDKIKLNRTMINWIKFIRNDPKSLNFKQIIANLNILSDHYLDLDKDIDKFYKIYDYDEEFYKLLSFHCTTNEMTKLRNVVRLLEYGTKINAIDDDIMLKLFTFRYDFENKKVIFDIKKVVSQEKNSIEKLFCSLNKKQKKEVIKHFIAIQEHIDHSLESEKVEILFQVYVLTFIEYFNVIVGEFDDKLTEKIKPYLE